MDSVAFVRAVLDGLPDLKGPVVEWLDWDAQPDSDEDMAAALAESVRQEDGPGFVLYQTMFVLKENTQQAINEGDRETVRRHFVFVDRALAAGDADVVNAIAVSYLEDLNFLDQKKQRSWAVSELPPRSTALARELQGELFPN